MHLGKGKKNMEVSTCFFFLNPTLQNKSCSLHTYNDSPKTFWCFSLFALQLKWKWNLPLTIMIEYVLFCTAVFIYLYCHHIILEWLYSDDAGAGANPPRPKPIKFLTPIKDLSSVNHLNGLEPLSTHYSVPCFQSIIVKISEMICLYDCWLLTVEWCRLYAL